MNLSRFSAAQSIVLLGVIGLVLFFGGFLIARSTASTAVKPAERETMRYQFLQVGDTVAAIDVYTGEAYAIDGNTRAWTLLAPALPAKQNPPTK